MQLEALQILACPICKGELIQIEEDPDLYCKPCGRTYPVIEGIPVLLTEQSDITFKTKCEK